jgi:hypothetical protein
MESNPCQCQGSGNSEKPYVFCAECKTKDFHFGVALFCCFVCFCCPSTPPQFSIRGTHRESIHTAQTTTSPEVPT